LLDEADFGKTDVGADIVRILNSGYQKNTPVVRMDANENGVQVPRVFPVFGPKIINGRQRFKDEATESRCLTLQPAATDRTDIPRQLPGEFEDEARDIRNRLLSWRLKNLDGFVVANRHIPHLQPRTNQIILPLLAVAECLGEAKRDSYIKDLIDLAKKRDAQSQEVAGATVEAQLLHAYLALNEAGTCKEIRNWVVSDAGTADPRLSGWLSYRRVASTMREMGFETPHTNRGNVPRSNPKRLEDLKARYGFITGASPAASPSGG
jgi:hypothetical protein